MALDQLEILFYAIKTAIEAIPEVGGQKVIKHVDMWNNQFEHEKENRSFRFPCVFIEFEPLDHRDLLAGVIQYDMNVILHVGFDTKELTNLKTFGIKRKVQVAVNGLYAEYQSEKSFFSLLGKSGEEIDNDHDNVQDHKMIFFTTGKDFTSDGRPTTSATLTDDLTKMVVKPNQL